MHHVGIHRLPIVTSVGNLAARMATWRRTPVVPYMIPPSEQGECGPVLLKPEQEFPVQLARDFLARASTASAKQMLLDGKDLLKATAKEHAGEQPRR